MEKQFSAQDICSIIKACGESGVTEFTLGKLSVSFKGVEPTQVEWPPSLDISPEKKEAVVEELTVRDELAHKEALLAQMEIEDPVEFERLMTAGDLVNSKDGDTLDGEGHSGAEQAL